VVVAVAEEEAAEVVAEGGAEEAGTETTARDVVEADEVAVVEAEDAAAAVSTTPIATEATTRKTTKSRSNSLSRSQPQSPRAPMHPPRQRSTSCLWPQRRTPKRMMKRNRRESSATC
jgi:hypothetical protein